MELMPPQDFRFEGAASSPYAVAPTTSHRAPGAAAAACTNPFVSVDDMAGNPFLASAVTAPPSPNPFDLLPDGRPGLSDAGPFDLLEHFTSAPASPGRAAAIYAHFGGVDGNDCGDGEADQEGFQQPASHSTVTSAVPFDWEEKPGKPKGIAGPTATANEVVEDLDFEFGVLLDKTAPPPELTTADELFNEGKIRPLKPPPRLHDGGSVASSPRTPKTMAAMWSPRRRRSRRVGSGADFDPFAAAMEKATRAPSPLGGKDANITGLNSLPKKPDTKIGGRKKWRLSDWLLFRRSSEGRVSGNRSKDPVFKYSLVQHLGAPVKNASAEPATANGDALAKQKKQSKKAGMAAEDGKPMPHKQRTMGCVRLNPGLHRLTRGFNAHSPHLGRAAAKSATKG